MPSGYSPTAIDHFEHPRHAGTLDDPNGEEREGTPGAGNFMVIQVSVENERIRQIAFQTYGCPGAVCCGSMISVLALGRTLEEADTISSGEVLAALGAIPLGKHHCAGLATGALRKALSSARVNS